MLLFLADSTWDLAFPKQKQLLQVGKTKGMGRSSYAAAFHFVEAVKTADRSGTAVDKISGPHP